MYRILKLKNTEYAREYLSTNTDVDELIDIKNKNQQIVDIENCNPDLNVQALDEEKEDNVSELLEIAVK